MDKIAITGADGQLGREFCRQLGERAVPLDRTLLDIADADAVRRRLQETGPAAVVNCAAYTKVDLAEKEPDLCRTINAAAVANLARECQRIGATLVQISTDYVFGADASRTIPYREDDPPGPQGVYAQTKLEGERAADQCDRRFVVRTCGLYGVSPRRNNFVETMLRLGPERGRLRIVDDQHCTPSYVAHVAAAVLFLLETTAYGVYHIVNAGEVTWRRFAEEIFLQAGLKVEVEPITTAQFGAPAPRPPYSVLDTNKYRALGGPELPPWDQALAEYLRVREATP